MVKKKLYLFFSLFIISFSVFSFETKELKVSFEFPKNNDMDKYGCILITPINIINSNNRIYISDQQNSKIFLFDLKGNFIQSIGKKGQSPSEFSNQHSIDVTKNYIYVEDQGCFKFKIFNINGKFISSFKQDRVLRSFVVVHDRIFGQPNINSVKIEKECPIFIIYDLNGNQLNLISEEFPNSKRNRFDYDNFVNIKKYNNEIHCMQKYGMRYRIYNINGMKIREFDLQNPDKNIWCLPSFYVVDNEIFAAVNSDEYINVLVFDFNGKFKRRYKFMDEHHEKIALRDFFVLKNNSDETFYFLVWSPDVNVIVAKAIK